MPDTSTNPHADRPYVNVESLTFGVEIECHMPDTILYPEGDRRGLVIGSYHNGERVDQSIIPLSPEGKPWRADRDGSIQSDRGRVPVEFVSPVLRGVEGLKHVIAVVRRIKELGGKVNSSCGLHIHIGFPTTDLRSVQRLVHLVAGFEAGMFASTGTKSREQGRYCKPIKESFRGASFRSTATLSRNYNVRDRFHSLNLANIFSGRIPTVEFRLFSGTLNPIKVAAYIQMVVGIAQVALSMPRPARWDGKAAGADFGQDCGQGERELNRLFRRLGWTRAKFYGRAGIMQGDGIPTLASCIRTLQFMARKYDGRISITAPASNVTSEQAPSVQAPNLMI
jgi:hypothetical protein